MEEKTQETALTLKFKGIEAHLLEEMIARGLFSSKSEAIRAALLHYFLVLILRPRLFLGAIRSARPTLLT